MNEKFHIGDNFILHRSSTSWGYSILIMEKNGRAFGRLYQYSDDNTTIYLTGLSVNIENRRQGLGTEMQEMRENIGRKLGATTACLAVERGTWMHDWYQRRGYEDFEHNDVESEENTIWMRKQL